VAIFWESMPRAFWGAYLRAKALNFITSCGPRVSDLRLPEEGILRAEAHGLWVGPPNAEALGYLICGYLLGELGRAKALRLITVCGPSLKPWVSGLRLPEEGILRAKAHDLWVGPAQR
jgi:hypothetical protein